MKLAAFIRSNTDIILDQWDKFTFSIDSASVLNKRERRDHAKEMLLVIAADLEHPQTETEQIAKSKGQGPVTGTETAAEVHGIERFTEGFSINETVAEYRALRANVLRLWLAQVELVSSPEYIDDMQRFNEAIDQALDESLASYTERKEMDSLMLDTILSASPDQTFVLDTQGRFTYVNDAALLLFKLPKADIVGKNCAELGFSFANEIQLCLQQVLVSGQILSDEFCFNFGSAKVFDCVFAPVVSKPENTVQSIVVMARDITLRKAAEEQSWQQANHDQLTGLPNRRLFLYQLQQDFNHAERFGLFIALLFIDLDGFKVVNDSLGHEAGDSLLRIAAERLNTCVRGSDTVARLGGDEFTVILKGIVDVDQTRIVAQKILNELVKPFHSQKDIMRISGSIGIAFYPGDARNQDGLIKAADHAMYEAKRLGRNQISFAKPLVPLAERV